ncbi:helix-turn-helix domain-containing protein [Yoonia sp.]|uniref:helix-turn-helix domain-containing protein n=1 Tax=Yoonia sp. TaxID=2212373 RepID=UPI00391C7DAB
MDIAEILHPVRLRIVQMLLGEDGLTTAQLHALLPDIPIASLYRQVARLTESGILVVNDTTKVRGTVEKSYCLSDKLVSLGYDALGSLKPHELNATFIAFCAGMIADFERYTSSGDINLARDQVHFHQIPFWATAAEIAAFTDNMGHNLDRLQANPPTGDRSLRIFSSTLIPRISAGTSEGET